PVDALLDLAAFADERQSAAYERRRAGADELREAEREVALCQAREVEASGAARRKRSQVLGSAVVTLEGVGDAGGRIELALEYHVPGARWAPMYQLRLDEAMTGGTLVLRACVAQRTDEDWTGVRLGLSTADLSRRTDLPELKSLRLGRRQSAPAHAGWREPPTGLAELFSGYDAKRVNRPEPDAPVYLGARRVADHEDYDEEGYPVAASAADPISAPPPMLPAPLARPMPAAPGGAPPSFAGYAGAPQQESSEVTFGAEARFDVAVAGGARMRSAAPKRSFAPPLPPTPADDLLDYAALELHGADEHAGVRGRLRPAVPSGGGPAEQLHQRAGMVALLPLPAHAVPPRDTAGSYDYRFDTAAPAEVPADGGWHTIPVCEIEIGLTPEFVCVPALDEAVFGTVVLANTSPHALLAGPADVSVAGEFLMTVPLPTLAPGARERVGVGVVESVQVARHAHMSESTAGLRNNTLVLDHRIEVEAVNHLSRAIRLDVLERVPVTDDKDVRIEEHAGKPRWQPDDELRDGRHVEGARVWRVELAAGERVRLTGGYEIRIPAAKAVVGGNRRV
ncbi:DUF4139 domain-containing protein, partial [Streptomyces sp. SID3343]|uniref:DUF4139 domain-containing protein n=1 Tax=Streptomyces sp. SID3343 TaxID=2690260 RepID=UPI001371CBC8